MNFNLDDALMGLVGGVLIGAASAMFLLGNGRIAGISGILGSFVRGEGRWSENLAFLTGLVAIPLAYAAIAGAPEIVITAEPALLVAGGLLVGIGTRISGGCTSGHGVCGMSRLSIRSISATVAFMAAGVAVASLVRPMLGAG